MKHCETSQSEGRGEAQEIIRRHKEANWEGEKMREERDYWISKNSEWWVEEDGKRKSREDLKKKVMVDQPRKKLRNDETDNIIEWKERKQ